MILGRRGCGGLRTSMSRGLLEKSGREMLPLARLGGRWRRQCRLFSWKRTSSNVGRSLLQIQQQLFPLILTAGTLGSFEAGLVYVYSPRRAFLLSFLSIQRIRALHGKALLDIACLHGLAEHHTQLLPRVPLASLQPAATLIRTISI